MSFSGRSGSGAEAAAAMDDALALAEPFEMSRHLGLRLVAEAALAFAAPVQAKGEVSVVPRVTARVDRLNVDVGSRVRAG